jgi:hypothetical protein
MKMRDSSRIILRESNVFDERRLVLQEVWAREACSK